MAKGAKVEEPLVNEFAFSQGNYVQLAEFGDARNAVVNKGGTAIERWMNADPPVFSEGEKIAILYCQGLWRKIDLKGGGPSETREYGRYLWLGQSEHEALAELATLKMGPTMRDKDGIATHPYRMDGPLWSVFELVCRFHESAALAGASVSTNSRSAIDNAKTYTKLAASQVAMRLGV